MDDYIKNITKKIISEELDKRIFRIKNKIFENKNMKKQMCSECGGKMYEWECMECGSMYEGNIQELGGMEDGHPIFGNLNFDEMTPEKRREINKYLGIDYEEDDDSKFNAPSPDYDYEEEDDDSKFNAPSPDYDYEKEDEYGDLKIPDDMPSYKTKYRYSDKDKGGLDETFKYKGRIGKLKTKMYPNKLKHGVTETDEDEVSDGWMHEDDYEGFTDGRRKIDKAKPYGKITGADFKALRSMKKEVEETLYELDLEEEDVEEGNAFSGALSAARKRGDKTFRVGGKTYPVEESYVTKKWKGDFEESKLIFTESEIISLIESIVIEEKRKKSTKADTYLKSSLGQSKKQEEDYIDSVVKKMKDYLKTGSKGKYEMSPKGFPKGNGELAKMDKMAYVPSKSVDEYITNFTAASLENLDYDTFEPNDERVSKYLKGSSETGNNPKWANAVETPVNDVRDKIRKNNYLAKLKKKAYNKAPQPVVSDKSGSESGADKIMMKLESVNGGEVITEMEKMKSLIGYNRKTQ